jgi:hypothetical protein
VEPLEGLIAISFLCRKIRRMANENPTLSASSSETRQMRAKSQIASKLRYFASLTLELLANGGIEAYESNREALPQRQTSFCRVGHPARSG